MKRSRRLRQPPPAPVAEGEQLRIVQHPDGYYWLTELHEVGPFATFDEARADMDAAEAADTSTLEAGETLQRVEEDIGIENWIDPDTGSPSEEQRPRIEEH